MKKLTILLFSILISFSSYGEWTLISEGDMGECCSKHYIDKDTIIENTGKSGDTLLSVKASGWKSGKVELGHCILLLWLIYHSLVKSLSQQQ